MTHIVQPLLYANVIIIVMLASNIWSSLAQHVNQPEDDSVDFMSNAGQHMDGGEVIASRLPMLNEQEPSCEELRAMWRFSRRQSRTSELSNELPTYRDPFKYNIWDPFYPRTVNRVRTGESRYFGSRLPADYTFGTVKYKVPEKSEVPLGRTRSYNYNDLSRLYSKSAMNNGGGGSGTRSGQWNWAGAIGRQANNDTTSGRGAQFRTGRIMTHTVPMNSLLTPQKGSFQRLKDLVWNERAREVAQQRRNDDLIARAEALKDLTRGQRYKRNILMPI